jgi:hypothetical protein
MELYSPYIPPWRVKMLLFIRMSIGVHYILNALHLGSWGVLVLVLVTYWSFPAVCGLSRRIFRESGLRGIVKRLQIGLSGVWILEGSRDLSLLQKCPDWLWSSPSLHRNGCQGSFTWVERVQDRWPLTPQLVPRLGISGVIHVFPHVPSWRI